jgi:hypothetical protein
LLAVRALKGDNTRIPFGIQKSKSGCACHNLSNQTPCQVTPNASELRCSGHLTVHSRPRTQLGSCVCVLQQRQWFASGRFCCSPCARRSNTGSTTQFKHVTRGDTCRPRCRHDAARDALVGDQHGWRDGLHPAAAAAGAEDPTGEEREGLPSET